MQNNSFRIVILFNGDLEDRKGFLNAVLARIKYLKRYLPENIECDVMCVSEGYGCIARRIKHKEKSDHLTEYTIDGIRIQIIWRRFSLIDYLLRIKLHSVPILTEFQNTRLSKKMKGYDLISAHSFLAADVAYKTLKKYSVPYCITWHGSDIHSAPFVNKYIYARTKTLIENAKINFFVSHALLDKSMEITNDGCKELLYNGISPKFCKYGKEDKRKLRERFSIPNDVKIIAFVGSLVAIKNAALLPDIFSRISNQLRGKLVFWIIGDGKLRSPIEQRLLALGVNDQVCMFGNVSHDEMPDMMNCIDLLVLPSVNEGLPLVTIEALRCGAMVIGSDVGGIPEAIGKDNVVPLGEDFVERFAQRCVSALEGQYAFFANEELDWDLTAKKEIKQYESILQKDEN